MKRISIIFFFLVISISVFSQTNVGGAISSDVAWNLSDSPYILTSSILINEGVTLTIEAGVIVQFNTGMTFQVNGELIARGTSANQIEFTSNQSDPAPGDWSTLLFSSSCESAVIDEGGNYQSGTILEYCIIEYGGNDEDGMLKIIGESGLIPSPFISHCTIQKNEGTGLYLSYCSPIITSCTIQENENGILLDGYNNGTNIRDNIIKNNESTAIRIGTSVNDVNIEKNIIFGNQLGVDCTIWGDIGDIKANKIIGNKIGIRIYPVTGSLKVLNNIIADNLERGIAFNPHNIIPIEFGDNHLINNGSDISGASTFRQNTFSLNNSSSEVLLIEEAEQSGIENCNFIGNRTPILLRNNNASGSTITCENNYWDTGIEAEIQDKIYDWLDDGSLGVVDYNPFLVSPNIEAPISPPGSLIKYMSGTDLILAWSENPESDVAGYKLYYGDPTGYSYATIVDLGNVTTYTIANGDINIEYALTAYDSNADGLNDQVEGYESWFNRASEVEVTLSYTNEIITENEGVSYIIATLNTTSPLEVSLGLDFSGTAINDLDYSLSSNSFVIPAGLLADSIKITGIQNQDIEFTETIIIDVTSVINARLTGISQINLNIEDDDDPAATLAITKTSIVEDESFDIVATIETATSKDAIINFELTGTAKHNLDFTTAFLTRGDPSTVAGGNGYGTDSDQLRYPNDISVDADGNMYILDRYNIKKWAPGADTGIIAVPIDSWDTRFFVDSSGNIYLSYEDDHIVKKWAVGATAWITVAGGNGQGDAANQLNAPQGIYVDKDENIYIVDHENQRIQKWAKGATEGVTVAGGNGLGSAANQLRYPTDVSINSDGDIYVLDAYRIQKWSPGAETGSTVVSLSDYFYYFFIDVLGNIFVTDHSNSSVLKWDSVTDKWTTLAGGNGIGGEADQLDRPYGITADNEGNLYVADCYNQRIQRVQYAPQIMIKAGETEGKISISGIDDHEDEFDETIIFTPTDASNCILSTTDPRSVTITDNDERPSVVFSFSEEKIKENSSTDVSLIATPSEVSGKDIEITFTLEGDAIETEEYVLSSKNITILAGDTAGRLNISTNGLDDDLVEVLKTITFRVNNISNATAEYDTASLYYESDDNPGFTVAASKTTIAEHESSTITATLETATSKDAMINFELAGTAKHDLDFTTAYLSKGVAKTVAGGNGQGLASNQLLYPTAISVDAYGNMYVLENKTISKWAPGADTGVFIANTDLIYTRFFVDAAGTIYLSERDNHRIRKWNVGATDWITVAGGNDAGSAANQLDNPAGIYVDADGNIYIADKENHRIQKWAEGANEGVTVAGGNGEGSAANQLFYPMDVSANSEGDIYILGSSNYRIQKWKEGEAEGSTVVHYSNNQYFMYFFVDVFGNIFVGYTSENSVLKWTSVTDQWITVAGGNGLGPDNNQLHYPRGITVDKEGNLYVADSYNGRIQKVQLAPQITVLAGETEGKLTISGIEDYLNDEGDETIIVKTVSAENAEFDAVEDISITLLDNTKALTLQENPFIGLRNGAVSWGDYDRDGDMDVAVMGLSPLAGAITAVYENQDGSFVNTDQAFTRLYEGDISWVDINKDGWIDLVVSGYGDAPTTKLYLNNQGVLEDTDDYGLPQLYTSKMAWGDLDNDGDIDLAISGIDADEKYVFYIYYREDNQANFTQETGMTSYIWPGFINGDLKIVDIDLDGDNDIVFSGQNADGNAIGGIRYNTYIESEIYSGNNLNTALKNSTLEIVKLKNTPNDGLSAISSGIDYQGNIVLSTANFAGSTDLFPKLKNGDISFADFDNDGLNDAVFTGEDEVGVPITKLFLQTVDGSFRASDIQLQGLRNSTANWVDYDMDGDLDLFLTGLDDTGAKTLLYEAETVNKVNSPPAVITGLNLEDLGNGNVRLSWDKPDDDFSTDLGYVLRLGTTSGGTELSNTESDLATGRRLISKAAPIYTNFFETQLDPGKYYWSVQAVDQGLKGASFSEESSFVLTYEWKILNQGGIIDRKINAVKDPVIKLADIDNDDDMDLIYGSSSGGSSQLLKYDGKRLINSDNNPFYLYSITAVEVGDINGDGITDVLFNNMANENTFDLQIYISNGANFTKYSLGDGLYKANGRIVDLNNDGQAEVVLIGLSSNQVSGKIKFYIYEYENTNATPSFIKTDVSDQIASLSAASFDLGDIDNDQDIDLILSGFSASLGLQSFIYENTTVMGETYQFVAMDNNLLATIDGTNDLIDFDGDGDLDAVITGTSLSGDVFEVFENQLNESVNDWPKLENTGLAPMRLGKIDLGDFNGDGYSDLLYSGTVTGLGKVTNLTEFNPTDNTFLDSSFDVSDIIDAAVEFGDLEGDGDLDFAVSGESSTQAGTYVFRAYVNVRNQSAEVLANGANKSSEFQNEYEDLLDLFTKNNPPSTPVSTSIKILTDLPVTEDGYPVEFSWMPSSDDHTPFGGITYSLKVGKTAGGEEIMSSNSNRNGTRKSATKGNVEHNTSWRLRLLEGTYYWSVQAIDASFTGSEFSPSTEFEISSALAVDNIDLSEKLYCYPNPTQGSLNIQIPGTDAQARLVVWNLVGEIVYQENIAIASDRIVKLDIRNLPAAMYMLSVETSNMNKVVKITKE